MIEVLGALCTLCAVSTLLVPMGVLLATKGYDLWELSEHRRDLLGDACLKCAEHVAADVEGQYTCKHCGFETRRLGDRWEELSELRSGLSMIREARFHLKRAVRYARWNQLGLVHSNHKYRELEQATRQMMDGYDLLRDLARTWPELLELPDPQEMVDPHDAATDMETGSILGVLLQLPLRARIAGDLQRGLAELDKGLLVVEGLIGGLAE